MEHPKLKQLLKERTKLAKIKRPTKPEEVAKLTLKLIKDKKLTNELLEIIADFLCVHIKNQVKSGASIIQIFDSWAGLVDDNDIEEYIYNPTAEIVDYVKSLKVPIICFPRNIKNYNKYTLETKPDVINIDYSIDPKIILDQIRIPVQGGLDPKILLSGLVNVKKETV